MTKVGYAFGIGGFLVVLAMTVLAQQHVAVASRALPYQALTVTAFVAIIAVIMGHPKGERSGTSFSVTPRSVWSGAPWWALSLAALSTVAALGTWFGFGLDHVSLEQAQLAGRLDRQLGVCSVLAQLHAMAILVASSARRTTFA
ncbi:MAG: hypothetical protein QM756_44135 [Polyangiaceae bacterium]